MLHLAMSPHGIDGPSLAYALQAVRQIRRYHRQAAEDFLLVYFLPDSAPSRRCRQQVGPIASDDEFILDCRFALFESVNRGIPSRLEDGAELPEYGRVFKIIGVEVATRLGAHPLRPALKWRAARLPIGLYRLVFVPVAPPLEIGARHEVASAGRCGSGRQPSRRPARDRPSRQRGHARKGARRSKRSICTRRGWSGPGCYVYAPRRK